MCGTRYFQVPCQAHRHARPSELGEYVMENAGSNFSCQSRFARPRLEMISLSAKVWGFRILIVVTLVLLCVLAGSGVPAWALAIAWSPNGLFLVAYTKGALHLPRLLERVHPLEPAVYRWLGVGLVKRIVANRVWPMIHGMKPPPRSKDREDFLNRIEGDMKAAEICHLATFGLASCIAALYIAAGRNPVALWILVFNVLLNAWPVMLQRSNRWRMQQGRALVARNVKVAA
jgi:hypothetical protein